MTDEVAPPDPRRCRYSPTQDYLQEADEVKTSDRLVLMEC